MTKPKDPDALEIGTAYKKGGKCYLAVAVNALLAVTGGEPRVVKPHKISSYAKFSSLSVEELCESWGITEEMLDALSARFMAQPERHPLVPRKEGGKPHRRDREAIGFSIRLVRFRPPG